MPVRSSFVHSRPMAWERNHNLASDAGRIKAACTCLGALGYSLFRCSKRLLPRPRSSIRSDSPFVLNSQDAQPTVITRSRSQCPSIIPALRDNCSPPHGWRPSHHQISKRSQSHFLRSRCRNPTSPSCCRHLGSMVRVKYVSRGQFTRKYTQIMETGCLQQGVYGSPARIMVFPCVRGFQRGSPHFVKQNAVRYADPSALRRTWRI